MSLDCRNFRRLLLSRGIAFAAIVLGADAFAQSASDVAAGPGVQNFVSQPEPCFNSDAQPLVAVLHTPHGAPVISPEPEFLVQPPEPEVGPAPRPIVAVTGGHDGEAPASAPSLRASDVEIAPPAAEAPFPPPIPLRSESAAPAAIPTALEAALARLIVHDGPVNPLGDGDWRGARAAIGAFYADRGFAPVWVSETGLTPAGGAVLAQLERAPEDGLDLSAIAIPRRVGASLSAAALAEAETTIAAAIVAYAEQAGGSRINPSRVSRLVSAAPNVVDPATALAETAGSRDPARRLADFNPPQRGYRALKEQLMRRSEALDGGRRDAGASLDREAGALGSPPLIEADADPEAGPRLEASDVRPKTLARAAAYLASQNRALAASAARRRAAILANMEMWRWEPRDMGERRIEVNVPDYSVALLDGDTVLHSARVVVGKPATPTPIFSNLMRYVLINPSWQVPDSIIRKEMLPHLASDPKYLARRGYEVKSVGGRLVVRQPPGLDNALGRVAFMFPNDYSVYLHDTPVQALFDEDVRALSHGCVRVEDPLRLAELVLGWSQERIDAAIGGPERTVFLSRPLPIHIEYFTEFIDEFGALQERPDVYGLTLKVAGILSATRQD